MADLDDVFAELDRTIKAAEPPVIAEIAERARALIDHAERFAKVADNPVGRLAATMPVPEDADQSAVMQRMAEQVRIEASRSMPPATASGVVRTVAPRLDWCVHTADHLRAMLDLYETHGEQYMDNLRENDRDLADLLAQIRKVYGEPPSV